MQYPTIDSVAKVLGQTPGTIREAVTQLGIKPSAIDRYGKGYCDADVRAIRQWLKGVGRTKQPIPPSAESR